MSECQTKAGNQECFEKFEKLGNLKNLENLKNLKNFHFHYFRYFHNFHGLIHSLSTCWTTFVFMSNIVYAKNAKKCPCFYVKMTSITDNNIA